MVDGSEHVYKKSKYEECPDCGGDLKMMTGNGSIAEGVGSRRAERLEYCPSCSPQNFFEKLSGNLVDMWDEL